MSPSCAAVSLLFACSLGACAAGIPQPGSEEAALARTRWPDATVAELHRGRELYVSTCAGCHSLKPLDAVPPDRWTTEVAEMRAKKGVSLQDRDAVLLVRYLWTAGTRLREKRSASR